ncbi:23S rRNA (pseudouridine(1915)-N(3))-methyltransferase RlmH [Thiospirillum jenense]|uniref:Ribosomal RNA large subunit methyltransferase H n=1 Tax=Thiospirillum jenense TaxID=1653858 RepID=A0A839HIM8_9GAMM|nr:23S rRNA (pseudouridine(1915)-N(3))-methyltransferase RlmH [Thiospirillum jenense]MBB1126717.1 23S rRNA (pseudouridine(1915)-N(3))-methyltransferase RlmH [Thiospirillum jenense]
MRIRVLSIGRKMPAWVNDGWMTYARRLPIECALELIEIEPVVRTRGGDHSRALTIEGERLLAALPKRAWLVALTEHGQQWSSVALSQQLRRWLSHGSDVALLIGGADGLAPACLQRADQQWSLSALTFPHQLVRVMVAEQLYRAWSLTQGHPYHRA